MTRSPRSTMISTAHDCPASAEREPKQWTLERPGFRARPEPRPRRSGRFSWRALRPSWLRLGLLGAVGDLGCQELDQRFGLVIGNGQGARASVSLPDGEPNVMAGDLHRAFGRLDG